MYLSGIDSFLYARNLSTFKMKKMSEYGHDVSGKRIRAVEHFTMKDFH